MNETEFLERAVNAAESPGMDAGQAGGPPLTEPKPMVLEAAPLEPSALASVDSDDVLLSMPVAIGGDSDVARAHRGDAAGADAPTTGLQIRAISDAGTTLEALRQLYESGATVAQLARQTQTAVSTLSRRLRASGAKMRGRGAPAVVRADQVAQWRAAYEAGASLNEVATGAGVCFQTVRHYLRAAGVQIRQPGAKLRRAPSRHAVHLEEWKRRYEAGASLGELSNEYGLHRFTIQYALERVGTQIRRRRSDLAGKPVERWSVDFAAGQSALAIARGSGVSEATVRRWLRKKGLLPPGSPRTRVDKAMIERWLAEHGSGQTASQIARAAGVHAKTVSRRLQERTGRTRARREAQVVA